jgi:hypothetical protein
MSGMRPDPTHYVRLRHRDTWHFCPTCSHWPDEEADVEVRDSKPTSGELCNQCQSKARRGVCQEADA